MSFLGGKSKSHRLIDTTRGNQHIVRPEGQYVVAALTRTLNTQRHKPFAYPETACRGLDVKESQFGDLIRRAYQEHRADDVAAHLGNPSGFALGIERFQECAEDFRDQSLVGYVPAVFLSVQNALAMGDPPNVTNLEWTNTVRRLNLSLGLQ